MYVQLNCKQKNGFILNGGAIGHTLLQDCNLCKNVQQLPFFIFRTCNQKFKIKVICSSLIYGQLICHPLQNNLFQS